MKQRIGVVGLGNMGMGMARNLVDKGFEVHACNRSPGKVEAFVRCGGRAAADAAAVGAAADIVFVMLVDAAQCESAIVGERGLLAALKPGAVIVVTATIGVEAVQQLAARAAERGSALIDCPVSGGRKGADSGELTLMAAGAKDVFDRCRPAFEAIAKNINHVGEHVGQGQVVKACLQSLVGCIYTGIFESLVLGVKAGVAAETIFQVLGTSVANTPLFQAALPAIMDRRFSGTGSNVGNTYKDLCLALKLAEQVGVPMPVTSSAKQFYQAGISKYPGEDNQCLVKLLEDVVGIEVRRTNA
jgi:L-threonate 2-dehydrogenase